MAFNFRFLITLWECSRMIVRHLRIVVIIDSGGLVIIKDPRGAQSPSARVGYQSDYHRSHAEDHVANPEFVMTAPGGSDNRFDNRLRRPCDHQGSPGSAESVRPSGLSKRLSEIPVAPPGNQNLPRAPLETVGKSNTFSHFRTF